MLFLLGLGVFQRVVGRAEIGAGILAVAVQEQAVKLTRKIIVMCHVPSGQRRSVVAHKPPQRRAQTPVPALPPDAVGVIHVAEDHGQQPADIIAVDLQTAFHIGLAQRKLGVQNKTPECCGVADRGAGGRARAIAVAYSRSVRQCDRQRSPPDQ